VDLTGIDLVVFDKDGTLIDFHAMWGGWARELGVRLEATARRPVAPDVFAAIGFDPTTGHVAAGGPLASATMAGIEEVVAAVLRRWCPSVAAARRATEAAWFVPDPVTLAVPLADLATLFEATRAGGRRIAVVTTDDRAPTDATLRALGVRAAVEAMVCGDDGFAMKPAPDAVFALCQALRSEPPRVAVIGDSPADIAMARAAGAGRVVGVLSGVGTSADLVGADVVLGSVADLLAGYG
jgi:phosphoglycolate phosphatase